VERAAEIMERRGVPGVAFAVSRALEPDVPDLCGTGTLLDRAGLRRLVRHGLEIGAHSHTHRPLVYVDETDLWTETEGSIRRLTAAGVGTVRLFAYPYGAHDARVRQCVARAGARAAFTVDPGFAVAGSSPLALPRIEIYRGDTGLALRIKVETGGAMLRVRACLRLRSRAGALARRFRAVDMPREASPHDPVRP
jgi:peptidoglycan/xylan/chitin deacetylase (PgdA/CDA1 family)